MIIKHLVQDKTSSCIRVVWLDKVFVHQVLGKKKLSDFFMALYITTCYGFKYIYFPIFCCFIKNEYLMYMQVHLLPLKNIFIVGNHIKNNKKTSFHRRHDFTLFWKPLKFTGPLKFDLQTFVHVATIIAKSHSTRFKTIWRSFYWSIIDFLKNKT